MDTPLQCILSAKRSRSRGFAINWTTFHFKICWWFCKGKDLNLDRVSTCWTAFSQSVLTNESIKAMWQLLFLDTSENTEISPDLLVWKICRNSQFQAIQAIHPKLCGNRKFPPQEIRWDYNSLVNIWKLLMRTTPYSQI